ncbi:MAG TPA: hypothetical protein VGE01_10960 [Fimbriimonas sp.]
MKELNRLAGGRWTSANGAVVQKFEPKESGRLLVGETTVKLPTGGMTMNARFGIDPRKDKVYYLDLHGETVYFGHVTLQDRVLVYEFDTLVGKPNRWIVKMEFLDDDRYRTMMQQWKDGGWKTVSDWSELTRER